MGILYAKIFETAHCQPIIFLRAHYFTQFQKWFFRFIMWTNGLCNTVYGFLKICVTCLAEIYKKRNLKKEFDTQNKDAVIIFVCEKWYSTLFMNFYLKIFHYLCFALPCAYLALNIPLLHLFLKLYILFTNLLENF